MHLDPEIQETFEMLCKEYKDIFCLNKGDIGHIKLCTMDIDTGDDPSIAQKPYTIPLTCNGFTKN